LQIRMSKDGFVCMPVNSRNLVFCLLAHVAMNKEGIEIKD
jgi:hypothetical protein